jgi:hypothetical protein
MTQVTILFMFVEMGFGRHYLNKAHKVRFVLADILVGVTEHAIVPVSLSVGLQQHILHPALFQRGVLLVLPMLMAQRQGNAVSAHINDHGKKQR